MGMGDHSRGRDLRPLPRITSSSGEGVGERYEEGRLTVAEKVRPFAGFPV